MHLVTGLRDILRHRGYHGHVKEVLHSFSLRFTTSTFMTRWIDFRSYGDGGVHDFANFISQGHASHLLRGEQLRARPSPNGKIAQPALRTFMDEKTILAQDVSLLATLGELIGWCKLSFKPVKMSKRLSEVKFKVSAKAFAVSGQAIITVMDGPVKSLGRVCDASLTNKDAVPQIREIP